MYEGKYDLISAKINYKLEKRDNLFHLYKYKAYNHHLDHFYFVKCDCELKLDTYYTFIILNKDDCDECLVLPNEQHF